MPLMKKEDFFFKLEARKEMEFEYKGKSYSLTYDKDDSGKEFIVFGRTFEGKKYDSYGKFMNEAKIENHFFKDMLEDLNEN